MLRIGVIGLGRLGGALVRGLDLVACYEIHGYNRSPEKGKLLAQQTRSLKICCSAREVLKACSVVFLWTGRDEAAAVLAEQRKVISRCNPLIVTCTLGVPSSNYTSRRVETLPNVNMPTGRGVTLVSFPLDLDVADRKLVHSILEKVGTVFEVDSRDMSFYSALCSCGPALYATSLEIMADTVSARHGYDRERCRRMMREAVLGTMLMQKMDDLDSCGIVERVAHPGGPSESGTNYLRQVLPEIYQTMLRKMKKW